MKHQFVWGGVKHKAQRPVGSVHSDRYNWERTQGMAATPFFLDPVQFQADLGKAQELGHTIQTVGIDWSALQPNKNYWDKEVIEQYHSMLQGLRDREMRSAVVLYQFINPLWFAQGGGWADPTSVGFYLRYIEEMVRACADLVNIWFTFDQPHEYVDLAYEKGLALPFVRDARAAKKVRKNLTTAQRAAYQMIRRAIPSSDVGVIDRVTSSVAGVSPFMSDAATIQAWHYELLEHTLPHNISAMASSRDLLLQDALYHRTPDSLPLYVMADISDISDDQMRATLIRNHLRTIEEAQERGVDVRGYMVSPAQARSAFSDQVFQAVIATAQ